MQNIFEAGVVAELTKRIERLTPTTTPQWGKMTVDQMLAHCCVTYEMLHDKRRPPTLTGVYAACPPRRV